MSDDESRPLTRKQILALLAIYGTVAAVWIIGGYLYWQRHAAAP